MNLFAKLVCISLSILYILFPKTMWKFCYGWQMKEESDPNEEILVVFQIIGALVLFFTIYELFRD